MTLPNQSKIDADLAKRLSAHAHHLRQQAQRLPVGLPDMLTATAVRVAALSRTNTDALILMAEAMDELPEHLPVWRERFPESDHPELCDAILERVGSHATGIAAELRALAAAHGGAPDRAAHLVETE